MVTRFKNRFELLVGDTPSDFCELREGPEKRWIAILMIALSLLHTLLCKKLTTVGLSENQETAFTIQASRMT